jgi:hypothetical protein
VRELQGAVFLPYEVCQQLWAITLVNRPQIAANDLFNAGVNKFCQYFQYWMQVNVT